jgi:diadenosine tetraphosphatase ApaH/serine/threonine PP2A family protein phosphatase
MEDVMSKRHILVGDVHGCVRELDALLAKVDPQAGDAFVFVGDLLDKGPDPAAVVRRVRELAERFDVVLIEGNHEDKHRRFRAHVARHEATGKTNPMKDPHGVLASTTDALSDEDVAFLDAAVMFHRVPEHKLFVVHGGVSPAMVDLPADGTRSSDLKGKAKRLFTQMQRVRFVDEAGKMVPLDKIDETVHDHWAAVYDGRFGKVVYGHEPYMDAKGPVEARHAAGIDLGCVFGGRLAALVVHADGSEEVVTQEAFAKYAKHLSEM